MKNIFRQSRESKKLNQFKAQEYKKETLAGLYHQVSGGQRWKEKMKINHNGMKIFFNRFLIAFCINNELF